MELEATVEELMFTIHAHPTLSESLLDGQHEGMAINDGPAMNDDGVDTIKWQSPRGGTSSEEGYCWLPSATGLLVARRLRARSVGEHRGCGITLK
jgi:hypothetical protein